MTNEKIRYSRSLAEAFPEERASCADGWAVPKKDFRLGKMADAIQGLIYGYAACAEPKKLL